MARNLANFDIMGDSGGGVGPSFMKKKRPSYQDDKQTAAQATVEGAERLGRLGSAMRDKKNGDDAVTRLQKYAQAEGERQRKKKAEEEAAKKKQKEGGVAPQKGFIQRMIDKYYYGKKDEGE